MRIGAFQFAATDDLSKNHEKILKAIIKAAENSVRLLVFQECAACGYPPVERAGVETIDFSLLEKNLSQIKALAVKNRMFIALGTIAKRENRLYNCIEIINPQGEIMGIYDKRALWGWDTEMLSGFTRGEEKGIFTIDGVKIGFRICFEIRFPEYFRQLYEEGVKLCFVSFNDVSEEENPDRYNLIKAHLQTRAVENVMTVVSVNSISKFQTAPTAVFSHTGAVLEEATKNKEFLLIYDYTQPEYSFGVKGILANNDILLSDCLKDKRNSH